MRAVMPAEAAERLAARSKVGATSWRGGLSIAREIESGEIYQK
jgi:hypothetical protein